MTIDPTTGKVTTGGAPVTMGPEGFWLDADGNVAATDPDGKPQQTPGQRDNPQAQLYYDADKDLFYTQQNGQKQYQSPYGYAGGDPNSTAQGTGHGMLQTMDKGGGAFHGQPTWNTQTGTFDVSLDWGKIGSMIVAGALTAGAVDAALGAGAASTASASAGTTAVGSSADGVAIGGALPSTTIGTGMVPGITGGTGLSTAAGATTAAGAGAGTASTLSKIAGLIDASGKAIGDATTAAGQNNLNQENLALTANEQNIQGNNAFMNAIADQERLRQNAYSQNTTAQQAYQSELVNLAKEEAAQRTNALKESYIASRAQNPTASPYNVAGAPKQSQQYLDTLGALAQQSADMLSKPAQYQTSNIPTPTFSPYAMGTLPAPTPYKPIDITNVQGATNTAPSTLQKIGSWVSPGLTTTAKILQLFG